MFRAAQQQPLCAILLGSPLDRALPDTATLTGQRSPQDDAPLRPGRTARAPAAPVRAAPLADAITSHRPFSGSSRHDDRLAITSRASDRAPAATHAEADPRSAAGRCIAVSAPSPRAMSRAPRARPNTRAARSSAAAPTHGRAGTEGRARAVRPIATRATATALAPRPSNAGIAPGITCAVPSRGPVAAVRGMYAPNDRSRGAVTSVAFAMPRAFRSPASASGPRSDYPWSGMSLVAGRAMRPGCGAPGDRASPPAAAAWPILRSIPSKIRW